MPPFIESGLSVSLPAGSHFRFSDTLAYKEVKSQSVKEMDFAWVDSGQLFLLEVRDYTQVTTTLSVTDFLPAKGQTEPFRFRALIDKVTDSVMMILSAWAGSAWGQRLKAELPIAAQKRMPLKVIVAVELPPALAVHLQGLRDSLNDRLRGRLALADVRSVVLIDYGRLVSDPVFKGFIALSP